MKSTRRKARPASRWMGLSGRACGRAPGFAHAQPADLFYERTVMTAADAALPAVRARGGRGARRRARPRPAARPCAPAHPRRPARKPSATPAPRRPASTAARATSRSPPAACAAAFSGYARISRLTYPGDVADWRADRDVGRAARWRWRRRQLRRDRMTFGLAGRDGAERAGRGGRASPTAPSPMPRGWCCATRPAARSPIWIARRRLDRRLPLAARLPPRSALKAYPADARGAGRPSSAAQGRGRAAGPSASPPRRRRTWRGSTRAKRWPWNSCSPPGDVVRTRLRGSGRLRRRPGLPAAGRALGAEPSLLAVASPVERSGRGARRPWGRPAPAGARSPRCLRPACSR